MFHFRDYVYTILIVTLLIMISCSWSATQKDILDAYKETAGYIDRNEWEAAASSMSFSTMLFLDSLALDLEARGLQGYISGADLLPILCGEYIDLSGDVTMIFIQGDQAEITLSSADSRKFQMILAEGIWKLSLEKIFRNMIDTALRGSYLH